MRVRTTRGSTEARRIRAGLAIVALVTAACGSSTEPSAVHIVITPSTVSLHSIDDSIQLTATAQDQKGATIPNMSFTWSSSEPSIASVSAAGLVVAKKEGSVTIRAASGSIAGQSTVEVAQTAAQLAFQRSPTGGFVDGGVIPFGVSILDGKGHPVRTWRDSVILALAPNTSGATLLGHTRVPVSDGNAFFEDVAIDRAGTAYHLVASYPGVPDAVSDPFDVVAFASVSASFENHTCALTTVGAAYCWGAGSYGELGDGESADRATPARVSGGLTFTAVSAGGLQTCGLTAAGDAYCWGFNAVGSLGDGTLQSESTPTMVVGGLTLSTLSSSAHVCGVSNGAAYCWGYNQAGELGIGSTTGPELCGGTACSTQPVLVAGGLTFTTVVAGGGHTCALTVAGAAYCWGYNGSGQLGDNTTTDQSVPVPVAGGLTFQSLAGGREHTCGLTTSGAAYCWGYNFDGGVGDGTRVNRTVPTLVTGGHTFASITAGFDHTCAVTSGGVAYCWGQNAQGELGDGTQTSSSTPVAVTGDQTFVALSAGGTAHTCGVTTTGAVYCWGDDFYGQLGNWWRTATQVPVAVGGSP